MYALVSLIIIIALSMLTVRVGAIALEMTGMSRDMARFQALSAFSGAGFTTEEAETVLAYPARRRIVQTLIRLGSVGVITAIASLVLSFTSAPTSPERIVVLFGSALLLVGLSRTSWFNRLVNPFIRQALRRTATLELRDYTGLLRLSGNHQVADFVVREGEWLANETLADLQLDEHEDILVLGIRRSDGTYVPAPSGSDEIRAGDTVIAYGEEARLHDLAERSKGDSGAPRDDYRRVIDLQRRLDPEHGSDP